MTGEQLEAIRERLDYTQEMMAECLACDYVGYKRYATGSRPVPRYIARCALLLDLVRESVGLSQLERLLTSSQWLLKYSELNADLESPMLIDLKVSRHLSGTHTLMRKDEGERMFRDCDGPLRMNSDVAEFYRAVAQLLHILHREGHNVSYTDAPHEPCPQCGAIEEVDSELHPGTSFVRCNSCGHMGPELAPKRDPNGKYSAVEVWAAWNRDAKAIKAIKKI